MLKAMGVVVKDKW